MIHLHLWKCLLKKDSFELGFEVREDGEILQAGRQRILESWSNKTERTVTNRFEIAFKGFSKVSCSTIGGCMKPDRCRKKLKGKRKMYRQSDGRQELQSCIHSRISQATNGVHSVVVLYGLAFVSSERAKPHCSEPSTVYLFVLHANQQTLSCSKKALKLALLSTRF